MPGLRKKVIDRVDVLCYIMYYLSDERSIFCALFCVLPELPIQYREAMPVSFYGG